MNQNVKFIIMAVVVVIVLAIYLSSRTAGPGDYDLDDLPAGSRQQSDDKESAQHVDTEAEREYRQGKYLFDNDDIEGGRVHLERAVELDPALAKAHNDLGVTYSRLGLYEQAISEYETALELDSGYVEAFYNLGNVLQTVGRNEEAIVNYMSALQLDKQYYRAYNNLGGLYALTGNMDSALVYLETATVINPDFVEAHRNLASVYGYLGDSTNAAEHKSKVDALQQP